MAREVMVLVICDRCGDRNGTAQERKGRNSAGQEASVDLCPPCATEVLAPFTALLDKTGRKDKRTRGPRPHVETQCVECPRVFGSYQGMIMHRVRTHGYTAAAA